MLFDRIDATGHVKRQFDDLLRGLGEAAENLAREAGSRRPVARPSAHDRATRRRRRAYAAHAGRPRAAHAGRARQAGRPAARARPRLRRRPGGSPPPVPHARRPEPVPSAPEPPRRVDDKSDARFDGARLVALQMAVAGSTREEVHSELQRAFRLADPSSILDDVFGGPRRAGAAS